MTNQPSMTTLFDQLGLDSTEAGIAQFIEKNQLDGKTSIAFAPFWTDAQHQLIAEKIRSDDHWAIIVDQLNEALHHDAQQSNVS